MEQTPQEYAKELVNEFMELDIDYRYDGSNMSMNLPLSTAKQCAKIAIKRILDNHAFPCYFKSDLICNVDFYTEALKEVDSL